MFGDPYLSAFYSSEDDYKPLDNNITVVVRKQHLFNIEPLLAGLWIFVSQTKIWQGALSNL